MKYELKRLSAGEIFGTSLSLYFKNFILLFLVSLAGALFNLVSPLIIRALSNSGMDSNTAVIVAAIVAILVSLISAYLATGLVMIIIARKYLDKKVIFSEVFSSAVPVFFKLLLLAIMMGLIFAGCVLVMYILALTRIFSGTIGLIILAAAMLLPMLIFYIKFYGSSGFSMDTGLTYHNKKVSKSGNYQSF